MTLRYRSEDLLRFAEALFAAAGMPGERAAVVAEFLVEADLMGHDTHGLNLAPGYLGALEKGGMPKTGEPEAVADRGAALAWDGKYLSGPWLVWRAMQEGFVRAPKYGVATIAIRRSHHIACLAAFLPKATERGLAMLLMSSDPANRGVAPYGSYQPVYTPDPIAFGYPTGGDPVLIDISASSTTLGLAGRLQADGGLLPGKWLIDNRGEATDDPAALKAEPPGAILPLGGLDRGHKGFGLGLMVEALTAGLGGYGRADAPSTWGAAVFLQMIDPEAFGGRAAFERETGFLAAACRAAAVPPGRPPVRMPGDGALKRRREQLARGVALYPTIMRDLAPWADKLGVAAPKPI
jgi:LDH2 family malate/lactate/ureidoglycolate dehydrogenase